MLKFKYRIYKLYAYKCFLFYYFKKYQSKFPLPPLHPLPSHSLPTPTPNSLQSWKRARHPALWKVQGSPYYIKVEHGIHTKRIWAPKASTCIRDKSQCQCHWPLSLPQLWTTFRGTLLIPCSLILSPVGVGELPLAQTHCLSGWTPHGLDFLAHTLPHSTL